MPRQLGVALAGWALAASAELQQRGAWALALEQLLLVLRLLGPAGEGGAAGEVGRGGAQDGMLQVRGPGQMPIKPL